MSAVTATLQSVSPSLRNTITISSSQRAHFLRLAEARGLKVAGLMGRIIDDAIKAGEIPDTLPGITVTKSECGVRLTLSDDHAEAVRLTNAETDELVRDLTARANQDQLVMLDGGQFIRVRRVGHGMALSHVGDAGTIELTLSKSDIEQLARQIEAARA